MRLLCLALLFSAGSLMAMDRFAALSMIESGDNDFARGRAGEVSRFQISRSAWHQFSPLPISKATDPKLALAVAQKISAFHCNVFLRSHGRPASNLEFYILWNAPAEINAPSPVVLERAQRFANLVTRK